MTSGNEATVPVRTFYTKQIVMARISLQAHKHSSKELINFVIRKKIQPVIDSIFPLQECKRGAKGVEAGLHAGKILLKS